MKEKLKNNIYFQLFSDFLKIGLFTIGGGMAMVPLIQREVVEEKHWMSEEEMLDCLAVAQGLPGVVAINTATYVGNYKKGIKGGLAASIGVMLPSIVIIILIAMFLNAASQNDFITGALIGIKGAAVGLIAYSAFSIGKKILKGWFTWAIALASFATILFLDVNAVWIIVGGLVIGIVYSSITASRKEERK